MGARRLIAVLVLLLVAISLIACGGGKGRSVCGSKSTPCAPTNPGPTEPPGPGGPPGPVIPPGPLAPAAPTGLVAIAGVGEVILEWNAVTGASTYSVYMSTSPGGTGAVPVQSNISGTGVVIPKLTNGVRYYFVVRAVNAGGASAASNEVDAMPAALPPLPPLEIMLLELAQTHVLPEAGLSWVLSGATETFHAVGGRDALAVMTLARSDGSNVRLEGWANGALIGSLPVSPPAALPPTESGGAAYANDRYTALIPAAWMSPSLQLRVRADNYIAGAFHAPVVGADSPAVMRTLPFYLYGAAPGNSFPLSQIAVPDQLTVDEVFAKWPVASLAVQNHSAQAVIWPTLAILPREGRAAYLADSKDDEFDSYDTMAAVLDILGRLIDANGERPAPVQYYAPLVMFNSAGVFEAANGGLGGGEVGTGDPGYSGIFIHEQGHAMGLPHQGEAYAQGRYPYIAGSLAGSAWGYDQVGMRFLGPFVPSSATRFATCAGDTFNGTPRQIDGQGRCVKQDPMQSGAGDQAAGYKFATFSDYSNGMLQRYFEGVTEVGAGGGHTYRGGSVVEDAAYPGGYRRWDTIDRRWVNVAPVTTERGLFGLDGNLPQQRNVPVHAVVLTYSLAGTPQVSQIYAPLSFTGNLIRYIDPTDATQRASITPNTGANSWYCFDGGCDYTLRITYGDGTQRHVLIQQGFRPFFEPSGVPPANATNPLSDQSFRTWAVNVSAIGPIQKVELLDTPMVWQGMPAVPTVLISRDFPTPFAPDSAPSECVELPVVATPAWALPLPRCTIAASAMQNVPAAKAQFDIRQLFGWLSGR